MFENFDKKTLDNIGKKLACHNFILDTDFRDSFKQIETVIMAYSVKKTKRNNKDCLQVSVWDRQSDDDYFAYIYDMYGFDIETEDPNRKYSTHIRDNTYFKIYPLDDNEKFDLLFRDNVDNKYYSMFQKMWINSLKANNLYNKEDFTKAYQNRIIKDDLKNLQTNPEVKKLFDERSKYYDFLNTLLTKEKKNELTNDK